MEEFLRPIVDLIAPLVQGRSVLEVACGTGNWTEVLAKRAQSVTATDSSETALKLAREKLSHYDNVEFECIDAFELGHDRLKYDTAVAVDWYSHVPVQSAPEFLKQLQQALRSDSWVVFVDMSHKDVFRAEFVAKDSNGNNVYHRKLPDGTSFDVIKNFPTEAELQEILAPFGHKIEFREIAELERWSLVYQTR
jgi:2-polyprenyl-3-methyl-5-hydroxy-6-metoxy-1,4-benzoquinol methylase